jgi:dTDP-4-dehydrorhamnose reductase
MRVISSAFNDYDFLFVAKDELAIDDVEAVKKYFEDHQPDYCVNCAAYTAVDKAETET